MTKPTGSSSGHGGLPSSGLLDGARSMVLIIPGFDRGSREIESSKAAWATLDISKNKQEVVPIKPSLSPESLAKSPPFFRKIRCPRVSVPQREMYLAPSGCSEDGPTYRRRSVLHAAQHKPHCGLVP